MQLLCMQDNRSTPTGSCAQHIGRTLQHTHIRIQVDTSILVQHHVPHYITPLNQPWVTEICIQKPGKVILHQLQHSCFIPNHFLPPWVLRLHVHMSIQERERSGHRAAWHLSIAVQLSCFA
jgi:hypothetical protein